MGFDEQSGSRSGNSLHPSDLGRLYKPYNRKMVEEYLDFRSKQLAKPEGREIYDSNQSGFSREKSELQIDLIEMISHSTQNFEFDGQSEVASVGLQLSRSFYNTEKLQPPKSDETESVEESSKSYMRMHIDEGFNENVKFSSGVKYTPENTNSKNRVNSSDFKPFSTQKNTVDPSPLIKSLGRSQNKSPSKPYRSYWIDRISFLLTHPKRVFSDPNEGLEQRLHSAQIIESQAYHLIQQKTYEKSVFAAKLTNELLSNQLNTDIGYIRFILPKTNFSAKHLYWMNLAH